MSVRHRLAIGMGIVSLWVFNPIDGRGQAFFSDSGHVEFESRVPLHSFTGRSDHMNGRISLADSTVDFFVDLTTLKTGIGKRDKDMRRSLETDHFPFAEFFGKITSPFDPADEADQSVRVSGAFKLHGIEKLIELEGTIRRTSVGLFVEADWKLQLKDYDIVPPRLLFVKVDQTQRIRLKMMLTPEDS